MHRPLRLTSGLFIGRSSSIAAMELMWEMARTVRWDMWSVNRGVEKPEGEAFAAPSLLPSPWVRVTGWLQEWSGPPVYMTGLALGCDRGKRIGAGYHPPWGVDWGAAWGAWWGL
jgi:hypothetical protein